MKKIIYQALAFLLFLPFQAIAAELPSKAVTAMKQNKLTPEQALKLLKEGNQRFTSNKMRDYNFEKEMKMTVKKGQFPIAVILSCIDSRAIPNFVFDQSIGNLFVARVAGNVADKNILGSMEFSTEMAGAKIVMVMGHNHCGAIVGTCQTEAKTSLSNLNFLMEQMIPAVNTVKQSSKSFSCDDNDTINKITKQNVLDQLSYIRKNSKIIDELAKSNQIMLVGAMNDIRHGKVSFFDENGKAL